MIASPLTFSCFSKKWCLGIKGLAKNAEKSIYCYFPHPLKFKYIDCRHSAMSNCYTKMLRGRQSCFSELAQTFLMVNCKLSKMRSENPGCLPLDFLAMILMDCINSRFSNLAQT